MTRLEALRALEQKVEAGEGETDYWWKPLETPGQRIKAQAAFYGSLDAAKALHEAVLPDNAAWWVEQRPDGRIMAGVFLGNTGRTYQAEADTPSRALLLAIIRALIAKETD